MYQLWADVTWGAPFFQTFGAQHCLGRSRRADKLLQGNSFLNLDKVYLCTLLLATFHSIFECYNNVRNLYIFLLQYNVNYIHLKSLRGQSKQCPTISKKLYPRIISSTRSTSARLSPKNFLKRAHAAPNCF